MWLFLLGEEMKTHMMRKFFATVLIVFSCLFLVTPAMAEEYQDSDPKDYITKRFDVTVEFDKAHRANVTEVIQVKFVQSHHGITRNIPIAKDKTYAIHDLKAEGYPYKTEKSGNNEMIRIGDADKYLKGDQTFVIHYQIEYYKDTNHSRDYLAQNLLPTEWATSIRKAKIQLTMPKAVDWDNTQIYYGGYGSSDTNAWTYFFTGQVSDKKLVLKGDNLQKGCGLTVRSTELPEGYWSEARTFMEAHRGRLGVILVLSVIFGVLSLIMWIAYGRDQKPVETVEFYPPEGMTPVDIGIALDELLEDREMMTLVFYLADKGYITIQKKDQDYILSKVSDAAEDEPEYVKTFLEGLFKKRKQFHTKKVPTSFRKPFDKAKEQANGSYSKKYGDVFTMSSFLSRLLCGLFILVLMTVYTWILDGNADGIFLALFPVIFTGGALYLAWSGKEDLTISKGKGILKLILGTLLYLSQVGVTLFFADDFPTGTYRHAYVVALFVIYFFSIIMKKRTEENVRLMGKILGFRRFIKEAEYDRIKVLCDEDPAYFYHILPYAAVMGLETAWTKHFEKIRIPQPDWYISEGGDFIYTAVWCSQMVRSCTIDGVPSAPASSGGSSGGYSGGFSGGGFSGGGGGGGGGGAW